MRILPVLLVLSACGDADHRTPPPAHQRPVLAHATQQDLAREVADAERLGPWRDVEERWSGQPLTWTVTRKPLLCHSREFCVVAAFPMQRPAKQGWMPKLAFAAGQYEALDKACPADRDCEVTIQGTLRGLTVSPDLPTNVELADVRVVKAGGSALASR